ncbi:unnamed protein product [Allacma fusca]|uniref:Tetraspanin n=1 Tax=Allacma fusca TaxID=39272 RepID=A0A8J2L963_9HEXA|nr:unnamed protein product [Allacma fusca]
MESNNDRLEMCDIKDCKFWKFGCTIYWGVAFFSTIFLIALNFQHEYVLPTDAYLYCEKLLKIDFTLLICFAIVVIIFSKSKVRGGVRAFGILAASGGLLLFSLYTLFLVETVTFPKMDEALEILRKRYAVDENILGYVQMKHKCCGIRNFTDWREIIAKQQLRREIKAKEDAQIPPAVVPSCCKSINHCGMRLYLLEPDFILTPYKLHANAGKLIPYVHNVADYVNTNGCYSYLKVNSNIAYETMRMLSCVALLFVVSIAIVFSYHWRKTTGGSRISRGWPSPPMDKGCRTRRIFGFE